jgi:hypothetical protein
MASTSPVAVVIPDIHIGDDSGIARMGTRYHHLTFLR